MKMKNDIFYTNEFNKFAANFLYTEIKESIVRENRKINIALSGGSTPIPVFSLLKDFDLEWEKINFFIVDERCVPFNDEKSNYGNINNVFFKHINSASFSFFKEGITFKDMLKKYQKEIERNVTYLKNKLPVFDFILLGMGTDGHTASLFPNTKALVNNNDLIVLNKVPQINEDRLTLTYPVLLNADRIIVLIKGKEKEKILEELYSNSAIEEKYPMYKIVKKHKNIKWIVEKK